MRFQEALVTGKLERYEGHSIEEMILTIRGQKVILDRGLAALYGVPTSRFNEAVKRNRRRFPDDFMFQLTRQEVTDLISQNAISSPGHGGLRKLPRAFTEHGAVMAANIMHSERAVQMSVFVVRAFVRTRQMLGAQRDLAPKLADLEKKLTHRLNSHETVIVGVLRQIMRLFNPPSKPEPPPKQIGFHVRESAGKYLVKRPRK